MSFEKFEVIELDENDLGVADVTSTFQPEKNPMVDSKDDEVEFEIEDSAGDKEKKKEVEKKDEDFVLEVDETEKKVEKKKEVKKETSSIKEVVQETQLLKQVTEFFIEEGIFEDFAEKDNIEYTEESFKELLKEQVASKAKEEFEKLTSDLSEEQKELIEFFKNGGNLSQLAAHQKDIEDYNEADTDDEDVAEQLIRINYLNKGKSEKWVKSFIESLKDRGNEAFKEEASESKIELVKEAEAEKERYKESVKRAEEENKFRIEQYNTNIVKTINSDTNLTPSEQKKLTNFLTLNKKLKNGHIVNELQIKLYEVQNDPKQYIELGKFLQDIDGYKNKFQKEADKKATLKSFNILKGKNSMTQSSSSLPSTSSNVKSKSPFEF